MFLKSFHVSSKNKSNYQNGINYPFVVPVYGFVQLSLPFGNTDPIRVQAIRSVEVRISIPGAVADQQGTQRSIGQNRGRTASLIKDSHSQKSQYFPALSLHSVGSATDMSPVTRPGFG